METLSRQFSPPRAHVEDRRASPATDWQPLLAAVWLCGLATVLARWSVRWRRIRRAARAASPLALDAGIQVMSFGSLVRTGSLRHLASRAAAAGRHHRPFDAGATGRHHRARVVPRPPSRQSGGRDSHAGRGSVLVSSAGVVDRRAHGGGARARLRRGSAAAGQGAGGLCRGHLESLPVLCGVPAWSAWPA